MAGLAAREAESAGLLTGTLSRLRQAVDKIAYTAAASLAVS
jgi:hypothetical protein